MDASSPSLKKRPLPSSPHRPSSSSIPSFPTHVPPELGIDIDRASTLDSNLILDPHADPYASNPFKRPRNHKLVVDTPTFDLDTYINGYRGRTKILRLLHIASCCPSRAINACHMALSIIQADTLDVNQYNEILTQLNSLLVSHGLPLVNPDQSWLDKANRTARIECDRLDAELRTYRHNSIKDSIRMGYNDLAEHHLKCGDLSNAIKCFLKARENVTSSKCAVYHTVNLIHCYLLLNQTQQVQINLGRLASLNDDKDKKSTPVAALEVVFHALVHLREGSLKNVARDLLQLKLSDTSGHIEEVMTCNDIAIIGGLCALATYTRQDLKQVLESNSFRGFLDLEPHIRDTLTAFVNAQYARCLSLLIEHKNDRLLDIYLCYHIEELVTKIRQNAIAQYCLPYSTIDLGRMAHSFACNVNVIELEVASLIAQNQLNMRIDVRSNMLRQRIRNDRTKAFTNVLTTGTQLTLSHQQTLLKMALAQANLAVVPPKRSSTGGGEGDLESLQSSVGPSSHSHAYLNNVMANAHLLEQMQWAISQSLASNPNDGSN